MKARGVAVLAIVLTAACGAGPREPRRPAKDAPSIGVIDLPASNALVGPLFAVTGWVLDEDAPIERVRIYIDDELMGAVPLTIVRPDVDKQLQVTTDPGRPRGFTFVADAGLRAGHYTVRVESLDAKGGRTQFATANIQLVP